MVFLAGWKRDWWSLARPMVANEILLTYSTENQNKIENLTLLKAKRDRNYEQLKKYYFLPGVFYKTLFIPSRAGWKGRLVYFDKFATQ